LGPFKAGSSSAYTEPRLASHDLKANQVFDIEVNRRCELLKFTPTPQKVLANDGGLAVGEHKVKLLVYSILIFFRSNEQL
jgi:hypothetical protein